MPSDLFAEASLFKRPTQFLHALQVQAYVLTKSAIHPFDSLSDSGQLSLQPGQSAIDLRHRNTGSIFYQRYLVQDLLGAFHAHSLNDASQYSLLPSWDGLAISQSMDVSKDAFERWKVHFHELLRFWKYHPIGHLACAYVSRQLVSTLAPRHIQSRQHRSNRPQCSQHVQPRQFGDDLRRNSNQPTHYRASSDSKQHPPRFIHLHSPLPVWAQSYRSTLGASA